MQEPDGGLREDATSPSYWYDQSAQSKAASDLLQLMREYRASETAMRRRTQDDMGMGENDLLALRYLSRAEIRGEAITPRDLGLRLGITTASMTKLVDRLVGSGHVMREPHPTDRRSITLHVTPEAHEEVRATLGRMHERMIEVARTLSPAENAVVARFLRGLTAAVDEIDADGGRGAA